MLEKIQIIKQRFDEISDLIIQPEVISDQKKYIKINTPKKVTANANKGISIWNLSNKSLDVTWENLTPDHTPSIKPTKVAKLKIKPLVNPLYIPNNKGIKTTKSK